MQAIAVGWIVRFDNGEYFCNQVPTLRTTNLQQACKFGERDHAVAATASLVAAVVLQVAVPSLVKVWEPAPKKLRAATRLVSLKDGSVVKWSQCSQYLLEHETTKGGYAWVLVPVGEDVQVEAAFDIRPWSPPSEGA
jgi:hypothetical protein